MHEAAPNDGGLRGKALAKENPMSIHNRIKIAFVADTLHSASGGAILSGEYVVNRLRRDHTVVAVGTDGDDALPSFQLPLRAMRESGFVMARPDRAVLARALAQVDIVHLQFPFWLSFAALEEARKLGLPVVAGFHVQPENALFNVGVRSDWLNDRVYHALVNRFYNKVDGVICPTPFAAEKRQDVIIEAVRLSRHRDQIRLVLSGAGPREAELRGLAAALPNGAELGFLSRETL